MGLQRNVGEVERLTVAEGVEKRGSGVTGASVSARIPLSTPIIPVDYIQSTTEYEVSVPKCLDSMWMCLRGFAVPRRSNKSTAYCIGRAGISLTKFDHLNSLAKLNYWRGEGFFFT